MMSIQKLKMTCIHIQLIIEMEQILVIHFMMHQMMKMKQINQIGSKVKKNIIMQRKKCWEVFMKTVVFG